jgi:hypothetical protein
MFYFETLTFQIIIFEKRFFCIHYFLMKGQHTFEGNIYMLTNAVKYD